ncbi:N-acetylmuramate alpha-1-phosphate uridylyltransferase MurU [Dyella flava]|uniref:Nucleotidyltransferase family protein n=1 Tax=Dyella flava TaxID=1920170 RepID=A0ABS2K6Y3_9GAMM|nr:nucleotidyltransferase family protein [Dyella flava]MBM7126537.1 nucleotidyltransferase family protein [Dyella flava]GLQ49644.1 mannose-1-phosphate guanylyltransferase [Dyella flava]
MRHALIFAAGLGERMRPLTDHTPKPLLTVQGKPLIAWHLEKLAAIGVHYVVINTSHLAEQFPEALGDGSRWGLRIRYAYEGPTPLETGGGMLNALPLLGPEPFIVVSGDVWTDADFGALPKEPVGVAHLLLVDNQPHHPHGDFALDDRGFLRNEGAARLTYSGIGVYRREFLHGWQSLIEPDQDAHDKPPRFKIRPLLETAIAQSAVTGSHHHGTWTDVGTPERLASLNR